MKRQMKAVITLLSIFMLLLVSACSGSSEPSSSKTDSNANDSKNGSKDRVVIEYWHTYSDQEEVVLNEEIKPLFEEQHPNIELKLTRMPYEGLKQQVIAGVAGNAAPDLMRMDIIWVPEFAQMGALKEVGSMDGFTEIKGQLFEGPLSTNLFEGKYYGLPVNTNTKVAIYHKSVLEKAGLTEPPKTMDELAKASKAIIDQGGYGGITIGGTSAWAWLPYFWSLGGNLTNDDFTKFDGYLNSAESIKAVETIAQWQKDGLIAPSILGGEPSSWDGMKNAEYLMIDDGPWFFSILMNETNENFDALEDTVRALIPEGPGGSRSVIGGEDLVIFANSKHPEEAWTFAKWMMSEEPQRLMSKTGLIPTNINTTKDPSFLETPFIAEYVKQLETALPRTPIPQWSEVEEIINLNFEKVIRGEMTVKDALDDAVKKAEAIIN